VLAVEKFSQKKNLTSYDDFRCSKCFDSHWQRLGGMYTMKDKTSSLQIANKFGHYKRTRTRDDNIKINAINKFTKNI